MIVCKKNLGCLLLADVRSHLEYEEDDIVDVLDSLFGEIHVDDEEAEPFRAAFLAAHEVINPAAGLELGEEAARPLVTCTKTQLANTVCDEPLGSPTSCLAHTSQVQPPPT